MASVEVRGGRIAIRFSNGQIKMSSVAVNRGMGEADIKNGVDRAKRIIIFDLKIAGSSDMAKEAGAISASSAASKIYRQLNPQPGATRAPARPAARRRSARSSRRTAGRRRARAAPRVKGPTITPDWIDGRLDDSGRGDYRAKKAATATHSGRLFVGLFLSRAAQRGVARTANQKAATVSVFKALHSASPQFRLLLASLAAQQHGTAANKRVFPEFIALQASLSGGNDLSRTDPAVLRGADLYIRYFLFSFAAKNPNFGRYRAEIMQLPEAKNALDKVQRAGTNPASIKLALLGTMDADTLTASVLYLRRWTLEHPARGRSVEQDRIDIWKAPAVLPLTSVSGVVPRPAATRPVAGGQIPAVGAIGDSITAGGRYARSLQDTLGRKFRGARVSAYGVSGQDITGIAARFRRDILANRLRFNTVIIQGGINQMAKVPIASAQKAVAGMIEAARAKGMKVIVLGITPWADYAGADNTTRNRTFILNNWMQTYLPRRFPGTVFVDMSPLGEPMERNSRILKLKREYDSGDHLHPNDAGRDMMARLIAQAAYGIVPTKESAQSDLQKFAAQQWKGLGDRIFMAVKGGRPADIVGMAENTPSKLALETALKSLKRDDIQRAYDRVFNDIIKDDSGFRTFCTTGKDKARTARIVAPAVSMSESMRPSDRRFIVMAMKRYINQKAAGNDDLGKKLAGDLKTLLVTDMKLASSRLQERDPAEDMASLAAMAVYKWRMANPTAEIGAWRGTRGTVPRRTSPPVREPPRQTPRPQDDNRRRTINI